MLSPQACLLIVVLSLVAFAITCIAAAALTVRQARRHRSEWVARRIGGQRFFLVPQRGDWRDIPKSPDDETGPDNH